MAQSSAETASSLERPSFALRPGVELPDWSVVRDKAARDALSAILEVFDIVRCFDGYSDVEDAVRRALLALFAELGRAPQVTELAARLDMSEPAVAAALTRLRARDLVVLDQAGPAVQGAYPFTERETGHRVRIGEHTLNAMCAVDALGAGAMYGADSAIRSSCRQCGASISISTADHGRAIGDAEPRGAVVWNGIYYEGQAASSLCTVIAFFCSDSHLEGWAEARSGLKGYRLSIDEALQVGRALFGPLLVPADEGA